MVTKARPISKSKWTSNRIEEQAQRQLGTNNLLSLSLLICHCNNVDTATFKLLANAMNPKVAAEDAAHDLNICALGCWK